MPDQSDAPQSVAAAAEQLPPAIRELHRAVLRGFRDSGQVHRDDLRPTAAALGVDLDDALHQLGSADLVHSAPDGQIEVAYPFSAPTHRPHRPPHRPPSGRSNVRDRCAGHPVDDRHRRRHRLSRPRHRDTDPHSPPRRRMDVATRHRRRRDRHTTDCSGTLADTLCGSITFHTDQQHAHSHLDNHPELHGHIIGQADAISLADCAFRGLLAS